MGIRLVGECVKRFAHLKPNPYKALVWMCYRTLDEPNLKEAIPAGFWFADWPELAVAIGWTVPTDTKARDTLRGNVTKVCRELVAAGAIEKVRHPNRIDNAAYRLVLQPSQSYLDARKEVRAKQSGAARRAAQPVDNVLVLDFGAVDTPDAPRVGNVPGGEVGNVPGGRVGNVPGGEVGNVPGGRVGNVPGPINRNQEPSEERVEEGVDEKGDDHTPHRPQPPDRARPVDNSPADIWAIMNAGVAGKLAAAAARNARHARPAPVGNVRPDGE